MQVMRTGRELMAMNHRKGMRALATGVAVAACAATVLALGGGSAAAAPGDTFYLSQKKKTFVSFVIGAGSDQISRLGYTARKLRCAKGRKLRAMTVPGDRTAPIQENLLGQPFFESFWARGDPGAGGIAGRIGDTNVKGSVYLWWSRKVNHRKVLCTTGHRAWTAKPVAEDVWLAARERQGYPEG
jgi:hypothetical protein